MSLNAIDGMRGTSSLFGLCFAYRFGRCRLLAVVRFSPVLGVGVMRDAVDKAVAALCFAFSNFG